MEIIFISHLILLTRNFDNSWLVQILESGNTFKKLGVLRLPDQGSTHHYCLIFWAFDGPKLTIHGSSNSCCTFAIVQYRQFSKYLS